MGNLDRAPDVLDLAALSKPGLLQLLNFVTSCQAIASEADVETAVRSFSGLMADTAGWYAIVELNDDDSPRRVVKSFPELIDDKKQRRFLRQSSRDVLSSLEQGDVIASNGSPVADDGLWGMPHVAFSRRFSFGRFASCFVVSSDDTPTSMATLRFALPLLHAALSKIHFCAGRDVCTLTERELEVLDWGKFGKTNLQIALQLNVRERTVKFHMENAMRKVGAVTRAHAIATALSRGLISWA